MKRFKRMEIDIDDLLLDPNNPRLIARFGDENVTSDKTIVKKQTMLLQQFDVTGKKKEGDGFFSTEDLHRGMKYTGMVPGNVIAVRKLAGKNNKYVVVEGNRRISTAKHLLRQETYDPEFELHPNVRKSLQTIRVKLIEEGEHQQDRIEDILITRHGPQSQMPWGPYRDANYMLEKYLKLSKTGDENLHPNEKPMTIETFRYENWRVAGTADRCTQTLKQVEDALKTIIAYSQIEIERNSDDIRPSDFSLLKALMTNRTLMGGYFERNKDTYKLSDSSCSRLETICQFGERDSKDKILKDDKSVSRLAKLYSYTNSEEEALEKYAIRYLQQIEAGQLKLDKALALIRDREKSLLFIDHLEGHIAKRDRAADGQLSYDQFTAEQADLLAYEEVKSMETLNWLEFFRS